MKKIDKEILEVMNGQEIISTNYEGCVMVKGKDVIRNGKVVDALTTAKKVNVLWKEFLEQEGI